MPAVQEFAQEGRPYALVTFCVALSCRLLVAALDRPGVGRWTAYGVVVLVGALLNWFSLLALCAHGVTIALVRPHRRTVGAWIAAAGAALLGALPLILASRAQSAQIDWIPTAGASTVTGLLVTLAVGGGCAWFARGSHAVRASRDSRMSLLTLALPLLALPPLLLLAASAFRPVYLARYVLFGHLGLALLIGAACSALAARTSTPPRRTVATIMACAFAALLPVQMSLRDAHGRIDDVLSAAADVAAVRETGDAVLYIPSARRDTALVTPGDFDGLTDVALERSPVESGTLSGVEAEPPRIARAMLGARRIVVVTDASGPPAGTARDRVKRRVLKRHFVLDSERDDRGRKVMVWVRREGGAAPR
ncbi:hypothetical protein ABZ953_24755 [Streptomyces sp. NPDC046465]|uniref:hypothetical protein n=1 Tax=Streptomyces sp. NPDC046465 TaxID=3155810 RepID=UPI00340849BF